MRLTPPNHGRQTSRQGPTPSETRPAGPMKAGIRQFRESSVQGADITKVPFPLLRLRGNVLADDVLGVTAGQ